MDAQRIDNSPPSIGALCGREGLLEVLALVPETGGGVPLFASRSTDR